MPKLTSLLWRYRIRERRIKHLKGTLNGRNVTIFITDDLQLHIRMLGSFVHLKESIAEQSQEGEYYYHKGKEVTACNMLTTDIYTCWFARLDNRLCRLF